ncbi:MAG: C-terminal helicase domain-containing protein [Bacteroidota bacterium]
MIILEEIFENPEEKVVVFSQWERMTRLVAQELDLLDIEYEYLHGGIPSFKRKDLIDNFHNKPESRVFLSTDAGGVGLNLQCAGTVINLDIPWNPAVLEQRIARVHRLGQKNHVRVMNFVSSGTIEERILSLIGFKQSVFTGVFDQGDNNVFMGEDRFKQFMRSVESITEEPIESLEAVLTSEENSNEKEVNQKAEFIPDELLKETGVEETLAKPEDLQIPVQAAKVQTEQTSHAGTLNDLFVTGIDFLQKLGNTINDVKTGKTSASSFIEKDSSTGKPYFKIPAPDEKVVEQALNTLSGLLQLFRKTE